MRFKPVFRPDPSVRSGGCSQLDRHIPGHRQYLLNRGNAAGYLRNCEAAMAHLSNWTKDSNKRLSDVDEGLVAEFVEHHLPTLPVRDECLPSEHPTRRAGPPSCRPAHRLQEEFYICAPTAMPRRHRSVGFALCQLSLKHRLTRSTIGRNLSPKFSWSPADPNYGAVPVSPGTVPQGEDACDTPPKSSRSSTSAD